MKMPFRADPSAALDKTRRKLADVEANIASLKAKRAELLATADADNIGEIQTVNKAIEAEESAKAIYVDKVKALQEECRKLTYQEREGQRSKAIAKIRPKLQRRADLAADLELALVRAGQIYSELLANDEVSVLWPFSQPGHGWQQIDTAGLKRELSWISHGLCREHGFPEPSNAGLGVTGIRAIGPAELLRQQNENIIGRLETTPLHNDLLAEEIA